MIDSKQYFEIASKYGHYGSWAIWADVGLKPKSNVGDLSIFDLKLNSNLLGQLNPDVVMVGLNISRRIEYTFGNFHDKRPQSQDYKLRHAFKNSKFEGAYMTDIIKDFEQVISGTVASYLKSNKVFERQNIDLFEQELLDIKSNDPLLIAFGNHSFDILEKHFRYKYKIVKVPHYSMHVSQDDYKVEVEKVVENI